MLEFTGERAIPGQVEADLWNEHVARYVFAAGLAAGRQVLDAGCGSGYGTAMLAEKALYAVGVDVAAEAIQYCRAHYAKANLSFLQASATALPFRAGSFELVAAFELIEHVENRRDLLHELRRVLAPEGQCLISTPNRLYYAEARAASGPNPYHFHEFDWQELLAELSSFFPVVHLFVENHVAGIAILPVEPGLAVEGRSEQARRDPAEAHYLLAVCSLRESDAPPGLIWLPSVANVLRERERHIAALQQELAQKDQWLEEAISEKQQLVQMYRAQAEELERSNRWAAALDKELAEARQRISQIQQELAEQQEAARKAVAGYEAKISELEAELAARAEWARELESRLTQELATTRAELEARVAELAECVRLLDRAEATVIERTQWAQELQQQVRTLEALVAAARASRWVRLGRFFGLGPRLGGGSQ